KAIVVAEPEGQILQLRDIQVAHGAVDVRLRVVKLERRERPIAVARRGVRVALIASLRDLLEKGEAGVGGGSVLRRVAGGEVEGAGGPERGTPARPRRRGGRGKASPPAGTAGRCESRSPPCSSRTDRGARPIACWQPGRGGSSRSRRPQARIRSAHRSRT